MLPWSSWGHAGTTQPCRGEPQPLPSQRLLKTECVSPVNMRTWSAQRARGLRSGSTVVHIGGIPLDAGPVTYLLLSSLWATELPWLQVQVVLETFWRGIKPESLRITL